MVVIVNVGNVLVVKIESGEGLLYKITHDLVNPFTLIKTLSKEEVEKREAKSENS